MKISILVPTLGERLSELNTLLESLKLQEYKDFEVIIITQIKHEGVENLIQQINDLEIKHVKVATKGLSYARNIGLKHCQGQVVVLSDDDCWYHKDSVKFIFQEFFNNPKLICLLTQIYDIENNRLYKSYSKKSKRIMHKKDLMSRSSIEIAFKNKSFMVPFDEQFGLGAKFICGEEVDFLINNYEKEKIFLYKPIITVYHPKKKKLSNEGRIIAKGALYAKNFNLIISILVIIRDLFIKHEFNIKNFKRGFKEYLMNK